IGRADGGAVRRRRRDAEERITLGQARRLLRLRRRRTERVVRVVGQFVAVVVEPVAALGAARPLRAGVALVVVGRGRAAGLLGVIDEAVVVVVDAVVALERAHAGA